MTDKRTRFDRRSEHRYPLGGRIFWRRSGRPARYPAWLSDTSLSSVSFITAEAVQPSPNDRIELTGHGCSELRCRVTRTAHYGARLSLVGCESTVEEVAQYVRDPPGVIGGGRA